ncbi:MAG: hypothetical protein R2717_04075 [Schumannella sp.]
MTRKLSWSRAALEGALSGAWFGLFIGLLFSFFTPVDQFNWSIFLAAILIARHSGCCSAWSRTASPGALATSIPGARQQLPRCCCPTRISSNWASSLGALTSHPRWASSLGTLTGAHPVRVPTPAGSQPASAAARHSLGEHS